MAMEKARGVVRCKQDMLLKAVFIVIAVSTPVVLSSVRNYDGSQVFRVQVDSLEKWSEFYTKLRQAAGGHTNITADIWRHPGNHGYTDLRVNKEDAIRTRKLLEEMGLKYDVTIDDVASVIKKEKTSNRRRQKRATHGNDVIGRYVRYDEILEWMDDVSVRYPTVAKVLDIGVTSEGRRMKVLKLGVVARNKWKVWVDGGIHAREWIAPATVIYLADKLLQGYMKKDNTSRQFLEELDFYILPVANPDGYEYSHTEDRLWRKNRKLDGVSGCRGIDLNRNWRFMWGQGFSSGNPCDADYRGRSPEDSVEVETIVNFLSPRARAFIAFLTYHSYGQRFITRWDYSRDIVPKDHDQLISLAQRAVDAMHRVHGTVYEAGRAPELMYPYGGGSPDWARAIANIKYSYLIELRNEHSFILPKEEIIPTGEENWAALRLISDEILKYYSDIPAPHIRDDRKWSRDNDVSYKMKHRQNDKRPAVYESSCASDVSRPRLFISVVMIYLVIKASVSH